MTELKKPSSSRVSRVSAPSEGGEPTKQRRRRAKPGDLALLQREFDSLEARFLAGGLVRSSDDLVEDLRLRARVREKTRIWLVFCLLGLLAALYLCLTFGAVFGWISVQGAKDLAIVMTPLVAAFGTVVNIFAPGNH